MPFDDEDPSVIGKIVLIGITYFDAGGEVIKRAQWWGRILAFNVREGLRIDIGETGEVGSFPPFRDGLKPARPGTYTLRSTGEAVEDPDFLYTLSSHRPAS